MNYHVVDTDNFGGDWPDEKFLSLGDIRLSFSDKKRAQAVADALNGPPEQAEFAHRYWKVVEEGYQLKPGFEP